MCLYPTTGIRSEELDLYAYLNSVILYCQIADAVFEHNLHLVTRILVVIGSQIT